MIGRTLAHYRVVANLGAGGMGEVYRATDTKLGREVALKILPDRFSADPNRVARFRREAQLLASLNHPNIAAIYGLEEDHQVRALVLELVEGATLQQRLEKGPLPVPEALAIARQIADALEAAHERGIVHRDLKPANIKLTPGGGVKVLDFGIAKALADDDEGEAGDGGRADEPTTRMESLTGPGLMMGTPAYMSPEQARALRLDQRVDIWAFGCVLFEMLTARPVFGGSTVSDVQAATLRDEPPWELLPAGLPASVHRMLRRCLQKDPKQRFRDVADARFALEDALDASGGVLAMPSAAQAVRGRSRWAVAAIAATVGAVVAVAGMRVAWPAVPVVTGTPVRFALEFASLDLLAANAGPHLTMSPDGQHVAFVASSGGPVQIYLRTLGALIPVPLAGTEAGTRPFFSPDGVWIGFFGDRKLKKVSIKGGEPVTLGDAPDQRGGTWGSDGTILVGSDNGRLLRVNADGSGAGFLGEDKAAGRATSYRFPEWLPGAKAVLHTVVRENQHDIAVLEIASGQRKVLIRGGTQPRYVESGHLIYAQQVSTETANLFSGALFAVPFDPDRLEITGAAQPIQDGVLVQQGGAADFSVSRTGTLVYMPGDAFERLRLVWVDRQGHRKLLGDTARVFRTPRLSPDRQRVAVTVHDTDRGLWLYDITRGTWNHLPMNPGEDSTPVWSPDGRRLAYSSDEQGKSWVAAVESARSAAPLATPAIHQHLSGWSPDGRTLAFTVFDPKTGLDIWTVPADGSGPAQPLLKTPVGESQARFSPDGRWFAYQSNTGGRPEVFIRPFPGPGPELKVSQGGGSNPVWTKNGGELCFRQGMSILAVDVTSTPSLSVSEPTLLFRGRMAGEFDAASDGSGFVTLMPVEEQVKEQQVIVVFDWFEDLRQRMKGAK